VVVETRFWFGAQVVNKRMDELIDRLSRLSSGGFESLCLRMEAPSLKVVESMRLQEASSLEGDSLPQIQAGMFRAYAQRERLEIF
jgi:hypothetical protein